MISIRSQVTQKVLNFFFLNPDESLHVNELSRRLELDKRNLVKKLRELERIGILKSEKKANIRLFSLDRKFPLYKEYQTIVLKTVGIEERLRQIIRAVPGVNEAHIYGSYADDKMDTHSDLDLLVIGGHDIRSFQEIITFLQHEISREINSVHIGEEEFKEKMEKKDPFLSGIFRRKRIRLV
jgi:predicted nucleotidyltransferase